MLPILFWATWRFCVFQRNNSPSHAHFWWVPWWPHWLSLPVMPIEDIIGGAIHGHGSNEVDGGHLGESLCRLKTSAAKTYNQKLSIANCQNMNRRHGWDIWKPKNKIIQGLHQIISSRTIWTSFWPLNPRRRPRGNIGFVVGDDSDENVEQLIVFVGEALLPLPEEAKINSMNRDLYTPSTFLESNK